MADTDDIAQNLELHIRSKNTSEFSSEICVIRKGPQVYKSISLMTFIDPGTGEIRKRELRAQSWRAKRNAPGFDFTETEHRWHCEGSEIDKLLAFLNEQSPDAGSYRLVRSGSDFEQLLRQVERGEIDANDLARFVQSAGSVPAFISALAASNHGLLLAEAVEVQRRKEGLASLRKIVENPKSTEPDIHAELKKHAWIFGGRYVGEAMRRELTTGDSLDIPLLQADGSLHVVELKKSMIPRLIVRHRSHLIPGPDVHEAVCQITNYLRALDEERDTVLSKYKIECRRAFGTVVIGHSDFAKDVDQNQVYETLRTYNSHIARIEVITYDQLLSSAEQALNFSQKEVSEREFDPEPDPDPWSDEGWIEPPF